MTPPRPLPSLLGIGPHIVATDGGLDYETAATSSQTLVSRGSMAKELDLEDLYRRYGDLVYGRCRSLLRNDADAQETMQEVFLKVWRYRASFRGEASPATYLFKVTTTTCLNRLRTRRRHPEDSLDLLPSNTGANDTMLDNVELRQLLDKVLVEADDRTVQCLIYHYVDGMTHDEVGELLGVTGAAIRKRLSQFRARISAQMPHLISGEEP